MPSLQVSRSIVINDKDEMPETGLITTVHFPLR